MPYPLAACRPHGSTLPSSLLLNLFAYWKGSSTADSGPNGLTLTNNGTVTFTAGQIGNAFTLNGTSQFMSLADSTTLNALEGHVPLTIAMWFKPTSATWTSANSNVLMARYGASFQWVIARSGDITADTVQFCVEDGTHRCRSTGTPTEDAWNFLVCQHDPDADLLRVSLNSAAFDDLAFANGMTAGTMDLSIGARVTAGGADFFASQIDEVGIWTRLLSASEITAFKNNGI